MNKILIFSTHFYTAAIKNCWRDASANIVEASSTEEFERNISDYNFDLIILDSDFEGNIFELAQKIRTKGMNINTGILFMIPGKVKYEFSSPEIDKAPLIGISKPFSRSEVLNVANILIKNKQQYDNLKKSMREIEQFSVMASHDLKTPLNNILSYSDILREEVGEMKTNSDELNEFSTIIFNETEKMLKLVDDIYSYSNLGNMTDKAERVSLNQLIDKIILDIDKEFSEKNIKVRYINIPKETVIDPVKLGIVFTKLIENSVKFSSSNDVKIDIKFETLETGDIKVELEDFSGGIKLKDINSIFEPFRKGEGQSKGTGIGLAIVKKLVESLGGEINVHNNSDIGCKFIFSFTETKLEEISNEINEGNSTCR